MPILWSPLACRKPLCKFFIFNGAPHMVQCKKTAPFRSQACCGTIASNVNKCLSYNSLSPAQCEELKNVLYETFNLSSSLSALVLSHSGVEGDSILLQVQNGKNGNKKEGNDNLEKLSFFLMSQRSLNLNC